MKRNIILPVVFYGCETWSLKLWEEGRGAYRISVGKPEGRTGRNRRISEIIIKMHLPEVGCWTWMD
jgi:hypothetical protein